MILNINTEEVWCPLHSTFEVNRKTVKVEEFGKIENDCYIDESYPMCYDRTFTPYPVNPELKAYLGINESEYAMIINLLCSINFPACNWCE